MPTDDEGASLMSGSQSETEQEFDQYDVIGNFLSWALTENESEKSCVARCCKIGCISGIGCVLGIFTSAWFFQLMSGDFTHSSNSINWQVENVSAHYFKHLPWETCITDHGEQCFSEPPYDDYFTQEWCAMKSRTWKYSSVKDTCCSCGRGKSAMCEDLKSYCMPSRALNNRIRDCFSDGYFSYQDYNASCCVCGGGRISNSSVVKFSLMAGPDLALPSVATARAIRSLLANASSLSDAHTVLIEHIKIEKVAGGFLNGTISFPSGVSTTSVLHQLGFSKWLPGKMSQVLSKDVVFLEPPILDGRYWLDGCDQISQASLIRTGFSNVAIGGLPANHKKLWIDTAQGYVGVELHQQEPSGLIRLHCETVESLPVEGIEWKDESRKKNFTMTDVIGWARMYQMSLPQYSVIYSNCQHFSNFMYQRITNLKTSYAPRSQINRAKIWALMFVFSGALCCCCIPFACALPSVALCGMAGLIENDKTQDVYAKSFKFTSICGSALCCLSIVAFITSLVAEGYGEQS